MYNSDVCYLCKRPKSRPKPQPLTSEQIREAAKASSEPLFRCDDHGLCEYDFILDGRCLHCGALGPPDQLEFLTRRQDRFELVQYTIDMDISPAEKLALNGVLDALEVRDSKLISEDGSLESPTSRIERLSTSADILKMSREHLDDTAYAALESGLLEIDSRECPWEEAIQIEATKGWWLPDDDLETIRKTMPHSSQCYCDGCLPQRQREQVKRGKSSYNSMTKAELRALLHERDLPYDDGFENETKAELIELLMQDDSINSFPMLVITILAVIGCIGVAVVYWPLVLLILALIIPGYIYAKLTGRGEMAEGFAIEKIGVDPDAHPEGWHDKPKKEEYPSTYSEAFFTFWSDPYFLLGFGAPILYAIYLNQYVWVTEKHAFFYIVAAVITNPFFGDPKESPFVRAGTGIHIATTGIVVLVIVLSLLAILLAIVIFVYVVGTTGTWKMNN
jgi:hypothetical protein